MSPRMHIMAATQITTILPLSALNQPPRSSNNNIPTMTFQSSSSVPRSNYRMYSDTSSPAASSSISTGQDSRLRSHSPYDILPSPSNSGSAPSLQLTLSHNGSDTSDSSAWVSVRKPGSIATGSAGASTRQRSQKRNAKNPQQLPPHPVAPIPRHYSNDSDYVLMVEGVPTLYPHLSNFHVSPGQRRIIPQALHPASHSNPTRPQAVSHHSQVLPPCLEGWDGLGDSQSQSWYTPDPGAGLPWNVRGLATPEQPATGESSHETIPVSTSYPQVATTTDTALRGVDDSTLWWKEHLLKAHHQFNDQRPLLGIPPPVGLIPAFSNITQGFIWGEPAEHIQMAAGVSSPEANSSIENFLDCNAVSIIPPGAPRATLAASSTSSTSTHPPSRVPDGLSILPVAGPRGLKRPIEGDRCEVPESTKIAEYAAVGTEFPGPDYGSTNRSYSSNLVYFPQNKRTRHRGVPATDNSEFIECNTFYKHF